MGIRSVATGVLPVIFNLLLVRACERVEAEPLINNKTAPCLAPRVVKISHLGFLGSRRRQHDIRLCRKLLARRPTTNAPLPSSRGDAACKEQASEPPDRCPLCKLGAPETGGDSSPAGHSIRRALLCIPGCDPRNGHFMKHSMTQLAVPSSKLGR